MDASHHQKSRTQLNHQLIIKFIESGSNERAHGVLSANMDRMYQTWMTRKLHRDEKLKQVFGWYCFVYIELFEWNALCRALLYIHLSLSLSRSGCMCVVSIFFLYFCILTQSRRRLRYQFFFSTAKHLFLYLPILQITIRSFIQRPFPIECETMQELFSQMNFKIEKQLCRCFKFQFRIFMSLNVQIPIHWNLLCVFVCACAFNFSILCGCKKKLRKKCIEFILQ